MKTLRLLPFLAIFFAYFIVTPLLAPVFADNERFAPFSSEGNPEDGYYFGSLWPLFHFIVAPSFKVYENRDLSRNYENLQMCSFANADRRDYECDNADNGCDGGDVDVCHRGDGFDAGSASSVAYTAHSNHGSCKLFKAKKDILEGEIVEGKCEYKKIPEVSGKLRGTDFSADDRSGGNTSTSSTPLPPTSSSSDPSNPTANITGTEDGGQLVYHKYQNEAEKYSFQGNDNSITWGSHYLGLSRCDLVVKKLMVLTRANQSKNTVAQTGEWPLGWVDWGYQTLNGKTLIQIYGELPGSMVLAGVKIVDSNDEFFASNGMIETSYVDAQKSACDAFDQAYTKANPDPWTLDFIQSPLYSPSWRMGYARGSICVWRLCCPGLHCPLISGPELEGNSRRLYYDISVSQAYGAAIDDLFLSYSREEGLRQFREMSELNPLIRFGTNASPDAIPPAIAKTLNPEMQGKCQNGNPSAWLGFTTHLDYVNPGDFISPGCPDYTIQAELSKEKGGALPLTFITKIIRLLWKAGSGGGGGTVDEVEPVKYHLITVPDALGQFLSELEQPVYDSRDTLAQLEPDNEYNKTLSNIVDATSELFYGGKPLPVGDAKRRFAYFACDDTMYSSPQATSVEAYAMGTRIGCFDTTTVAEGKCDGQLFGKLIAGSKYESTSTKGSDYFNSSIKARLTPELMNTYAAAEKETGVPCEILAGIHFVEADNNPNGSLVSGRAIGTPEPDAGGKIFRSLLETAVFAGAHLNGKVGGSIKDAETAITALSRYNGGGNSNCQVGYPFPIPYAGCPRAFEGEDDPYPTNFVDNKHNTMYLLYCADHTACVPQVFARPGSFTVAINVYNSITKDGYENSDLPPTPSSTPIPSSPSGSGTPGSVFFPRSCGPESLSTALGCIPYTSRGFITALLSFIVGISGAVALITMLMATIQIMTAAGDAKKSQAGKELFTSALSGLLFLIFSVTLLRIIAGDIIKLPGF